ncbi:MAG: hypothetical protein L0215_22680 [Gemmataceae bacterium]|nr:hypothetical protein [Gemmataceae bacterium]
MALALDDRGLLPNGVHDASLEEVEALFARFQKSDRRLTLFKKLRDYLAAVKKAGCGQSVIINGSFVMGCVDEPEDIDLILVLSKDWDWDADLKPYQYNLVSKRRVRKDLGFDLFLAAEGTEDEQNWIKFFSRVNMKWRQQFGWPANSTKGLVRVAL